MARSTKVHTWITLSKFSVRYGHPQSPLEMKECMVYISGDNYGCTYLICDCCRIKLMVTCATSQISKKNHSVYARVSKVPSLWTKWNWDLPTVDSSDIEKSAQIFHSQQLLEAEICGGCPKLVERSQETNVSDTVSWLRVCLLP